MTHYVILNEKVYKHNKKVLTGMEELKEVENKLRKLKKGSTSSKWKSESYIGSEYSFHSFLNLKVPDIRNLQKQGYSFCGKPIHQQWEIWDYIWVNSNYFEAALAAVHFASARPIEELYLRRTLLINWVKRVDNWALSDELSKIYSMLLEYNQQQILPVFEGWNCSSNPWEKRQSMVGLLFYSRLRKRALPCKKILKFVEPHLEDSHYYVQKAVGWTFRECWNLYPAEVYSYLLKNVDRISAAAWTAATEKLPLEDKAKLKNKRRRLKD